MHAGLRQLRVGREHPYSRVGREGVEGDDWHS
jgi:hypothetical protein